MEKIEYLDFELMLRRQGKKYQAVVVKSPAGEARHDFSLPFSDLEIENYLLRLGNRQTRTRRAASSGDDTAKAFGGGLFNEVFDGEVGNCFLQSLAKTDGKKTRLRIRFRLNEVPELADLPWEYVYNKGLNRFQALDPRISVVRHLDVQESVEPLKVESPLKILVMISSPDDPRYPELDTEAEWSNVQKALGKLTTQGLVQVDLLEKATLKALNQKLKDGYHVFHFIGHAVFDGRQEVGFLLLENENGQSDLVNGEKLAWTLQGTSVRLCVLNACEGARSSLGDVFTGAAQSLVQQGVPAVVAMQFEITDDAAVAFAEGFYGSLAKGEAVDAAVTEARREIQVGGYEIEWGTPVLFLRAEDGYLFDVTLHGEPTAPDPRPIASASVLPLGELEYPNEWPLDPESPLYVERQKEPTFLAQLKKPQGNTYIIKGPHSTGKSSLLNRMVKTSLDAGKRAAVVDFLMLDSTALSDFTPFLHQFCSLITDALDLDNQVDEYWKEAGWDLGAKQCCTRYIQRHVLKAVNGPLVVALDHVEIIFRSAFHSHFFSMLRGWHNSRANITTPIWKKLDLILATGTEPRYFIDDLNQSPFNVGISIDLEDFTEAEVHAFAAKHGVGLAPQELGKLHVLLGGHPYLTRWALYLRAKGTSVADLERKASGGEIEPFDRHLRNLLTRLREKPDMPKALKDVLQFKTCADEKTLARLQGVGLVRKSGNQVVPRCSLYEIYFKEKLK